MIHETFGVHSYCFRNFDNHQTAAAARELGLDNVGISNVHGRFQEPDGFEETIAIYRDAGLQISSIGVVQLTGDEATDRNSVRVRAPRRMRYYRGEFQA